jgi:hypothetical protein
MTGPGRTPPKATLGESGQLPESAGQSPLAWQRELDGALADLDSKLTHPRRRATDVQPTLPQLGQPEITSEVIDEIAWRVASRLREQPGVLPPGPVVAAAIAESVTEPWDPAAAPLPPPPRAPEREELPHGIALSIRIRRPLFRWPFRRRRPRSLMSLNDYRVT